MNATAPVIPASYFNQTAAVSKKPYVKEKNGAATGADFTIPKSDFSRFLGYAKESEAEKQNDVSGPRTLEVALNRAFDELGDKAMVNGNKFRNNYVALAERDNRKTGSFAHQARDGMDAMKESVEIGHAANVMYLELQYKFDAAMRSSSTISNLMKVRHEATKKIITEAR